MAQGSQFTSFAWTDRLTRVGTPISMDGKGRCRDNIFIERLWWSLKYECVYLHAWETGLQAKTCAQVVDYHLQPPASRRRPWRATALHRSAAAESSLNQPETCQRIGELDHSMKFGIRAAFCAAKWGDHASFFNPQA